MLPRLELMSKGLKSQDIEYFLDMLIKANPEQLYALEREINRELSKRGMRYNE